MGSIEDESRLEERSRSSTFRALLAAPFFFYSSLRLPPCHATIKERAPHVMMGGDMQAQW